jgi:signal transduction histidine kinase
MAPHSRPSTLIGAPTPDRRPRHGVGGAQFGQGSGLVGLKDRVEALGGRISVSSEPGAGTALNVELPLGDD